MICPSKTNPEDWNEKAGPSETGFIVYDDPKRLSHSEVQGGTGHD